MDLQYCKRSRLRDILGTRFWVFARCVILGGARMRAPRMDQYGDLVLYMVPVYRTAYVPRYTYSLYMYDLYVHVHVQVQ